MNLKPLILGTTMTLVVGTSATISSEFYKVLQSNSALKIIKTLNNGYKITNAQWIDYEENLQASQHNGFNPIEIHDNQKLKIILDNKINNDLIFNVFAKKPEKNYKFSLTTNHQIANHEISESTAFKHEIGEFIVNKFFQDKTTRHNMTSDQYRIFFDTLDQKHGTMLENEKINFRSSWGVWNNGNVNSSFKFNFNETSLIDQIFIAKNDLLKITKPRYVDIETVQPKQIALLPLVLIDQPPIGEAHWTTNKITFDHESTSSTNYVDYKQRLIMPEGHNSGAEWWRGITSTILGLGSVIVGMIPALLMHKILIKTIIAYGSIMAGVEYYFQELQNAFNKSSNNLIVEKILKMKNSFEEIYKLMRKHQFDLHNIPEINWPTMSQRVLSATINGNLEAHANATSIFGTQSQMNLYTTWGIINANISYSIYHK